MHLRISMVNIFLALASSDYKTCKISFLQCIQGLPEGALRRIILTASGGAFRCGIIIPVRFLDLIGENLHWEHYFVLHE